ncbi:MAG: hypothetical protein KC777_09625 [Cyanobacteria bacterium HKST-UBA02]|nr:hypothetical protein [Cyanobacteria bacterium HKST-UBA02]
MMELVNVNDGGKNNEVFGQAGGLVTQDDWDRYNDKLLAGRKSDKQSLPDCLDLPSPFDNSDDKIRMNKKEKELNTESSEGSHSQDYQNEQLGTGPVKDGNKKVVKGGIKDSVKDHGVLDADRSRSVKPDIGSEERPGPTFDPGKTDSRLDGGDKAEILLDINYNAASVRPAPILTQPFTVNRDGTITRGTTRSAPLGK